MSHASEGTLRRLAAAFEVEVVEMEGGLASEETLLKILTAVEGGGAGGGGVELPPGTAVGQVLKWDGTVWAPGSDTNTTYTAMTAAEAQAGTATTARTITPKVLGDEFLRRLPNGTLAGQTLEWNGTAWVPGTDDNTTYATLTAALAQTGTETAGKLISAKVLADEIERRVTAALVSVNSAISDLEGRVTALEAVPDA